MIETVLHILPIFLLIGLGHLLRIRGLFSLNFWADVERLTFYFLFPALLVYSIGGADIGGLNVMPMASGLIVAALIVAAVILRFRTQLSEPPLNLDGPAFCSVFQGVTRPNTYLGLAAAFALFGDAGLALMAVSVVAIIPLVNVLAVVVHQRWASAPATATQSWPGIALQALKNPVIGACLIGAALNITNLGLPPVVGPVLGILGKGALPLGLMAVGAGLDFRTLSQNHRLLGMISGIKLIVLPAVTWSVLVMLGVEGMSMTLALIFAALPVSATSYVMSRQMGGDGPLMAGIVTATTAGSLITLPVIISALS